MSANIESAIISASGACHCGNLSISIQLSGPAQDIELRACQCSFCQRHGAKTFADPRGKAIISIGLHGVIRYQFGLHVSDYLICPVCGVYVVAMMPEHEHGLLATINAVGLSISCLQEQPAMPVDYGHETSAVRIKRRRSNWMPIEIHTGASPANV